jgi:hypothetical protein
MEKVVFTQQVAALVDVVETSLQAQKLDRYLAQ